MNPKDSSYLFTLRVSVKREPLIVIHAFDRGYQAPNHNRIDVEVRQGGAIIFPRGALYCAVTQQTAIDGIEAKELVLSLVSMKPGDTDADYFAGYTDAQLDWARSHGDVLSMVREARYCDPETGECRRGGG